MTTSLLHSHGKLVLVVVLLDGRRLLVQLTVISVGPVEDDPVGRVSGVDDVVDIQLATSTSDRGLSLPSVTTSFTAKLPALILSVSHCRRRSCCSCEDCEMLEASRVGASSIDTSCSA